MTLNTFKHWYRYHHQGRPITIVKRYNANQGIVAIPVLATGSPREGFLEPFTITSIPSSSGTGPQGTGPQGTGPQGTGPQGTGPQGTGPQGTGPQGTGPQGTGEITSNNFFSGTEKDTKDGLLIIYVYCGMTLAQAVEYQQNPPLTPLHQGVKGISHTLPTTWMAASRWLENKGISYTKKHRAQLDPTTLGMKGVVHNYYQLTFPITSSTARVFIKEEELANVPHKYDETQNAYIVLIKTYGYVKKSSNIIRLLNKALISRDKASCLDYATAFLEHPVFDIDMTKIDWSKPIQGIDIIKACTVNATHTKEAEDGEDMGVSLPASYDF